MLYFMTLNTSENVKFIVNVNQCSYLDIFFISLSIYIY